jgi:hypothetical protein
MAALWKLVRNNSMEKRRLIIILDDWSQMIVVALFHTLAHDFLHWKQSIRDGNFDRPS